MTCSNKKEYEETQALEVLLRFLHFKRIIIPSVTVALYSLEASKKYKVTGFDAYAVNFIEKNLAADNVLTVLQKLSHYSSLCACKKVCSKKEGTRKASSSKEEMENAMQQNQLNSNQEMYNRVINKCLRVMDNSAERILNSEEFEQIPLKLVHFILKRDSICVASELSVLNALDRWARSKCYQLRLSPSPVNKQAALAGAQYLVRFLTMTPGEIKLGQTQCGLLREKEMKALMRSASHPSCTCPLNKRLQAIRKKLATPRKRYCPVKMENGGDGKNHGKIQVNLEKEEVESRGENDKEYEHVGKCVDVAPLEEDEETENIYASIDGADDDWIIPHQSSLTTVLEIPTSKRKEKRCTCVRVKRSRTVYNESEMQKYRAFYQRGGRYSRERIWSNGSNSFEDPGAVRIPEFNTLEKLFFCITCMFD